MTRASVWAASDHHHLPPMTQQMREVKVYSRLRGEAGTVAPANVNLALVSARSAAMASRSSRRCPSAVTPSSFRFSYVRLGRTVCQSRFRGTQTHTFQGRGPAAKPPLMASKVARVMVTRDRSANCTTSIG
jgi:hypothetical protein